MPTAEPWKIDPVWTILDLIEEKDKMILTPEYQRGNVWSTKKQQLLIDSIMREWEIGRILLNAISREIDHGAF